MALEPITNPDVKFTQVSSIILYYILFSFCICDSIILCRGHWPPVSFALNRFHGYPDLTPMLSHLLLVMNITLNDVTRHVGVVMCVSP